MTNIIDQNCQLNAFYRNIFNARPKQPSEVTKSDLENYTPKESKGFEEGITAKDLFKNPTCEDKELLNERWVNEIYTKPSAAKKHVSYLIDKGYTSEESETVIPNALDNVERQKEWSQVNEETGKEASNFVNGIIGLGVVKELLDNESVPKIIRTVADLAYGVCRGRRNYLQNFLYNRPDDDAAMNRYQADIYDNKVAGVLANAATFTEMKINSWALPLVELLPEKFKEPAKKLLTLPASEWWRARMPGHINQQFFTDFFRWSFHIIPSLFGHKDSVEVINGVKNRGNLSPSYIFQRHCKNAGLVKKEEQTTFNFLKQVPKLVSGCFSSNLSKQKDSAKKLGETAAPSLGFYGFFAMGVGTTAGSVLKILDKEHKFFDYLTSTAVSSQQLIYFPKMVVPLFNRAKQLQSDLLNPEKLSKDQIKQISKLSNKKRNLAYLGAVTFGLNLLNNSLKLKTFENPILKKGIKILDEVSLDLISKFFSHRRHLNGLDFKVTNHEFYDPATEEAQTEDIELAVV